MIIALAAGYALLLAATEGKVRVVNGDSLVISDTAVRLGGVDLPAAPPALAEAAREHVHKLVTESFVSCRLTGEMLGNQMLGTCFAGGEDIGAGLVERGMALDCPAVSGGRYRQLEAEGLREHVTPSGRCTD